MDLDSSVFTSYEFVFYRWSWDHLAQLLYKQDKICNFWTKMATILNCLYSYIEMSSNNLVCYKFVTRLKTPWICTIFYIVSTLLHGCKLLVAILNSQSRIARLLFPLVFVMAEEIVWQHSQYRVVSVHHNFRNVLIGRINTTFICIPFVILLFSWIVSKV